MGHHVFLVRLERYEDLDTGEIKEVTDYGGHAWFSRKWNAELPQVKKAAIRYSNEYAGALFAVKSSNYNDFAEGYAYRGTWFDLSEFTEYETQLRFVTEILAEPEYCDMILTRIDGEALNFNHPDVTTTIVAHPAAVKQSMMRFSYTAWGTRYWHVQWTPNTGTGQPEEFYICTGHSKMADRLYTPERMAEHFQYVQRILDYRNSLVLPVGMQKLTVSFPKWELNTPVEKLPALLVYETNKVVTLIKEYEAATTKLEAKKILAHYRQYLESVVELMEEEHAPTN